MIFQYHASLEKILLFQRLELIVLVPLPFPRLSRYVSCSLSRIIVSDKAGSR